ncbi:MAG: ATP-binding protein [Patescibacteria group bacterium]
MEEATIEITFDKSHLVTIGEKLYGESLELLRELIANAYDADAAHIWIEVRPDRITVRDDGSGMDEAGLREFFRIGSQGKRKEPVSPRYRRHRIGQFGIGKFAVLAACERFRVATQRDGFSGEVVFEKRSWAANDLWLLPLHRHAWNPHRGNGTTVTLEELTKQFVLPDIERFIRERLPLTAPHFTIVLNGKEITPTYVPGRRFPVSVETRCGWITGELLLPNVLSKKGEERGIECVVRGVVVCRSTFGLELPMMEKLRGRVTADFVPITSDRSRFITDSEEYCVFSLAMEREIRAIARELKDLTEQKERQKADETLRDTLTRMRRAIRRNPDIAPPVLSPTGEITEESERQNAEKMAPSASTEERDAPLAMHMIAGGSEAPDEQMPAGSATPHEPPPRKIRVKNLQGKTLTARAIKIGGIGITCALEQCGREQPAAFTESGIVFINMDHPLYGKIRVKSSELLGFYLTHLLSQQVALLFAEGDARKAFRIEERLLTDSW